MNRVLAITIKELNIYFFSPMFYIAFAAYVHIVGLMFVLYSYKPSSLQLESGISFLVDTVNVSNAMTFILALFLLPFFTMHLFADELKMGTDELLLTSPANIFEIVIGKYISAIAVLFMMIVASIVFPIITAQFGDLDWRLLWTNYLAFFLLGATIMAIGLFTSVLSENQIISSIISILVIYLLWLIGTIGDLFFFEYKDMLAQFSIIGRMNDMKQGLLDLTDVIFYVSFIVVFLVLTIKVFERKRWN